MAQQQPLFDRALERKIVPAADRDSPAVWIAELRVLRELGLDEQFLVRSIRLRRGMNILWAQEPAGLSEKQLFEDSLSGHSAGKTTFCRFLRYILGEPHFGDEILRQEIRRAFPNGWAAAHVFISGAPWAVLRPLGIGSHPFVVRGASIDEALLPDASKESLDVYREALNAAVLGNVPVKRLSASGEPLQWDHLLPWTARDQDCHFDGVIAWRESTSDSGSPQLDASDRQFLLRAILGLISDEEDQERRANDERNLERKQLAARRPALLHQSGVDRRRLVDAVGAELPPFDNGLFKEAVNEEIDGLEKRELESLGGKSQISNAMLADLESDLQVAVEEKADASAAVREVTRSLARQESTLKALKGEISEEKRKELLEQLGPSSGFCNVPMETAVESGCPLASTRPIQFAEHAAERGLEEQVAQHEGIVRAMQRQLTALQEGLTPLRAATARARDALKDARQTYASEVQRLADIRSRMNHLRRLSNDAEAAWEEAEELVQHEKSLQRDIEQSYKRQEAIREQLTQDLAAFSARFNHFISALLGESVEGRVVFSGRDIDLKVLHRGERRSSAIRIVTNIAFDLAAMTSSMEGRGFHPRLLIHDGPREADMSVPLYRKVFLLAQMLETCVGSTGEPAFQYIITTTEAPPPDLQRAAWLLEPVLDAAEPSKRFLGVDL